MGRINAVILAGGCSSRMGKNKALLQLNTKPIIKHQIEELSKAFEPVVVVSNEPELYSGLGVSLVQDEYPGYGPLAGIQAGLKAAPGDGIFVIPCDMPFISADLGLQMVRCLGEADGVVLLKGGKFEGLCAVYRKSCLPFIEEYLQQKKLKVTSFFPFVNIKLVPVEELNLNRSVELALLNINTPDDFDRAKSMGETPARPDPDSD